MKIRIADVKPNPFRNLRVFPLDRNKVAHLMKSMKGTDYWDNIVVRKSPDGDGYEAAFGHHRLDALRRLYGPDALVPFIVKPFDDTAMLRCMGEENLTEWATTMANQAETVRAVVEAFRERRIAAPALEKKTNAQYIRTVEYSAPPDGAVHFTSESISKVLGGNWDQQRCAAALSFLDAAGAFGKARAVFTEEEVEVLEGKSASQVERVMGAVQAVRRTAEAKYGTGSAKAIETVRKAAAHVVQGVKDGSMHKRTEEKAAFKAAGVRKVEKEIPNIDKFAADIVSLLDAVMARDVLEKKVSALVANADAIGPSYKRALVRALRDLAKRASHAADQIEAVSYKSESKQKQLTK